MKGVIWGGRVNVGIVIVLALLSPDAVVKDDMVGYYLPGGHDINWEGKERKKEQTRNPEIRRMYTHLGTQRVCLNPYLGLPRTLMKDTQ